MWRGSIAVAQNSTFRMSGGASIGGSVKLSQASNGFFNTANGGANNVAGGVSCPWTTVPSAHLAGPTSIAPNPTLATTFASATRNQCLPF